VCFPNLERQDAQEWTNDSHKYFADVLFANSTKEECCVIPHVFARFEVGCDNGIRRLRSPSSEDGSQLMLATLILKNVSANIPVFIQMSSFV